MSMVRPWNSANRGLLPITPRFEPGRRIGYLSPSNQAICRANVMREETLLRQIQAWKCGRRLCSARSKLGNEGGDYAPQDPSLEKREETLLREIQAWKSGRRLCSARSKLGKAGGDFAPRDPSLDLPGQAFLGRTPEWMVCVRQKDRRRTRRPRRVAMCLETPLDKPISRHC